MNMQTKILREIEVLVGKCKAEFIDNRQYANTGRVYIQEGFVTLVDFTYSFQTHYCTIEPGKVGGIPAFHYLQYHETERIETLLDAIRAGIGAARRARASWTS